MTMIRSIIVSVDEEQIDEWTDNKGSDWFSQRSGVGATQGKSRCGYPVQPVNSQPSWICQGLGAETSQ